MLKLHKTKLIKTLRKGCLFFCVITAACTAPEKSGSDEPTSSNREDFEGMPPVIDARRLELPAGFSYELLFSENRDTVQDAAGLSAPAREKHDLFLFIPITPDSGVAYVGHESYDKHAHGDGGGGTIFPLVWSQEGIWKSIGRFKAVDFSPVGGTLANCGGTLSPWGTVLTAEEFPAESNKELYLNGRGVRDTSDYNGRQRYLNNGFITEVDLHSGKALRKLYAMGRFSHEDLACESDKKTVYLTDDFSPSVFFKFVADEPGDYSRGVLHAYKQTDDGVSGSWIALPRSLDSLFYARDVAIRAGATLFNRMEWIEPLPNGKYIISETGKDHFNWENSIALGAKPAVHLNALPRKGNTFSDVFGRLLLFDPVSGKMDVWLQGGISPDSTLIFSNPDGLSMIKIKGEDFLVVHEDGWGSAERLLGREDIISYNEVFLIKADLERPKITDLKRLAVAPKGSETTGGYAAPGSKGLFMCIQAPDSLNPAPFNVSTAVYVKFPDQWAGIVENE